MSLGAGHSFGSNQERGPQSLRPSWGFCSLLLPSVLEGGACCAPVAEFLQLEKLRTFQVVCVCHVSGRSVLVRAP